MNKTVDSSIVKLTNYRSVWGYIHKNKQATIPQISKDIGLSLPTVTRAVDYGVAEGIIEPDGVIGAERGRKAQVYKLHADYMHFLLIYLDSEVLSYRIHDFRSRTIGSGNMPVNDKNVLSALEKIIECSAASDPLLSIVSIAVSGVVCDGVVKDSAAFPSLVGMDLSKHINRKFGMTALVDNDLHAASNVARIFSDYKNDVNVLFAFGKRKSGAGIIVNGDVLRGASGAAGEIGNIPVYTPDIESERVAFCSERLQAIIALVNPKRVIIYELDEGMGADKLISLIKEKLKAYLLPEFKLGRDFFEDCFRGLSIMCELEIKRSLRERLDF